jgi:hypothetical protein
MPDTGLHYLVEYSWVAEDPIVVVHRSMCEGHGVPVCGNDYFGNPVVLHSLPS